jgi:hypothetical protein
VPEHSEHPRFKFGCAVAYAEVTTSTLFLE